jgi:hypothetical protein
LNAALLFANSGPPKPTPSNPQLNATSLNKNAQLQQDVTNVINGLTDGNGTSKQATGEDLGRYKVKVVKSAQYASTSLTVSSDGTIKPDKTVRPPPAKFLDHMLKMIADESLTLQTRTRVRKFTSQAFQWKEDYPWWCIYEFYTWVLQEMEEGWQEVTLDPKDCGHYFTAKYAPYVGQGDNWVPPVGGGGHQQRSPLGNGKGGGGKGQGKGQPLICNRFNDRRGNKCSFTDCKYLHACSKCGSRAHGAGACTGV